MAANVQNTVGYVKINHSTTSCNSGYAAMGLYPSPKLLAIAVTFAYPLNVVRN